MQYFSCCSDKHTEIKMYDLEMFSKIQSHIIHRKIVDVLSHCCLYYWSAVTWSAHNYDLLPINVVTVILAISLWVL